MKKNKVIILTSIIVGVLVVTLGLTYAAITFNETKGNSQLVLGDIWMHYNETNQLVLSDAMPMDINDYTTYKVNPVMASQSVDYKNELTVCVTFLTAIWGSEEVDSTVDIDETYEDFCKGTGTNYGETFQSVLDNGWWNDEQLTYFEENNVILVGDDGIYTINPIMQEQSVQEVNELSSCVAEYWDYEFADGSTAESFCKGTGITEDGLTIQEDLDTWIEDSKEYDYDFLEEGGQELLDAGVILSIVENLPYFEFKIDGKNTYTKKDIIYDIVLNHGDEHATRTTRIRDDLLRFTLIEVVDGNNKLILNNKKYKDLSNRRIYVDTIPANTNEEINRTYRLYMWISKDTVIGNYNQDYTLEEWNDVFASIKVSVTGDFNEKIITTDEKCFDYEFYLIPNPVMQTQNETDETTELYKCIQYFTDDYEIDLIDGATIKDFCLGNAVTSYDNASFVDHIYFVGFQDAREYLLENNIIIESDEIKINWYDETCGSEVIIPREIDGYEVKKISGLEWNGYGGYSIFSNKNVTSVIMLDNIEEIGPAAFSRLFDSNDTELVKVIIPEGVTKIGAHAFSFNNLSDIVIPNSVETIGSRAFFYSNLTNIEIPDSVIEIGSDAFGGNSNLESIKFIGKTCDEIVNIVAYGSTTGYFPWGASSNIIFGTDGKCS